MLAYNVPPCFSKLWAADIIYTYMLVLKENQISYIMCKNKQKYSETIAQVKSYNFMENILKSELVQIYLGELQSDFLLCKMLLTWLFSDHSLGQQVCIHPTQLEALTQDLCGNRGCFCS